VGVYLRSFSPLVSCHSPLSSPFIFILLRIAFSPNPLFSQPSALPPGVTLQHSPLSRGNRSVLRAYPILSATCALFFSLAAVFSTLVLYFQSFAHSFAKTRVGTTRGSFAETQGRRFRFPRQDFSPENWSVSA